MVVLKYLYKTLQFQCDGTWEAYYKGYNNIFVILEFVIFEYFCDKYKYFIMMVNILCVRYKYIMIVNLRNYRLHLPFHNYYRWIALIFYSKNFRIVITLRVWYILSHVTISVNRSARIFKRVYFSDFTREHFTIQKKSAVTTFTFFTWLARAGRYNSDVIPRAESRSATVLEKNTSRVTFIMESAWSCTRRWISPAFRPKNAIPRDDFPDLSSDAGTRRLFVGRI